MSGVEVVAGILTHVAAGADGAASGRTGVGPGWVAFVVVVALCVATTLLWLNMRKQLKKIRFDEVPDDPATGPHDQAARSDEAGSSARGEHPS